MLQSVDVDRETGDGDVLMQQLVNTDRLVGTKEKRSGVHGFVIFLGCFCLYPLACSHLEMSQSGFNKQLEQPDMLLF